MPESYLEFYLVTEKPSVLLSGTVSSFDSSAPYMNVNYNNGTLDGTPLEGNTVRFTRSGSLIGEIRLRSHTGTTTGSLDLAENSDVVSQLQVSDTVEVLEEWRLWPIAPRIVQDGEDITFYEDYDIAYTNQTEYWKPYANVGPPAVAIMATGTASVTVDFVGDRSFAVSPGATLTAFNWSAPGSSESSSTSQGTEGTPVTFTYTSAGQYVVSLTVTDSNGNVAINYTKVFVIDPFNLGDNVHTVFDSISDNMDWQQGGTESNFIVYGTASVNQFPREGRVLHVVRGNPTTPTATWPNRSNILFNGYIVGTSISQNVNRNTVSFRAITIDGLMKNLPVYPVSLTDNNSPSEWTEAKDITIDRCLTFLAHYRSTLSLMTSIIPLNYTAEIQRQDFNPGVLHSQMEELLKDGWAHCASSHQGVLYWERDYNLMTTSERSTVIQRKTLTKSIWMNQIEIDERPVYMTPVSKYKMSGVYYAGSLADVQPLFSEAPGDLPKFYGQEQSSDRLILTTQEDLNERCGLALAKENQRFYIYRASFINDLSFGIVPQEKFPATILSSDNNRGLQISPTLIPRRIRRSYLHDQGYMTTEVEFEADATGPPGITVLLPSNTDDLAPSTPAEIWNEPLRVPRALFSFDENNGLQFLERGSNDWETRNSGVSGLDLYTGCIDLWWRTSLKQNTSDYEKVILFLSGRGKIYRSVDSGKSYVDVTPNSNPPNTFGDTPTPSVSNITFTIFETTYGQNQYIVGYGSYVNNSDENRTFLIISHDDGQNWIWASVS